MGSEMCIRDRAPGIRLFEIAAAQGARAAGEPASSKVRWGMLIDTCLLYTSDAADERSSVDLGGRRIIKKKKNRQLRDEPA